MNTLTLQDGTEIKYLEIDDGFSITIKDIYGQMVEFDIAYAELNRLQATLHYVNLIT